MQMVIDNVIDGVKGKTLIEVVGGILSVASPEKDASIFVRQALAKEHASPSPNAQHIKILTFWLRVKEENEKLTKKAEEKKDETPQPPESEIHETLKSLEEKPKS